jgi:REP element-mobilizing transposase RayT
MPRGKRIKIEGAIAHYHIISRTVGQQFLLGDVEKDRLVQIIRYFARMFFVKINAYCIMSNHFHLVVQTLPGHLFSDEEVCRRMRQYMQDKQEREGTKKKLPETFTPKEIRKAREKLENISEFCRAFKQTFSRWYNKENDRSGHFWSERFKSLVLGTREGIQRCCAYAELNPLRAGIVARPEDYRWCSLHNRQFAPKHERFCSFDGLFSGDLACYGDAFLLKEYRSIVYYLGNIKRTTLRDLEEGRGVDDARSPISDELYDASVSRDFELSAGELLLGRMRYFTDGIAIGSKEFLTRIYKQFGGTAILKKDRNLYPTGIAPNLFSIRRLRPKPN